MTRYKVRHEFKKCLRCGTEEKENIYHSYCRRCFLYIVRENKYEPFVFFCERCGCFFKSIDFNYWCGQCNEWRSKKDKNNYIYLASDNSGYTKIGQTKNVKARISNLKTANPNIYCFLYFKEGVNVGIEKALHNEFENKRISGEWFDLSKNDIRKIINDWCIDDVLMCDLPNIVERKPIKL